MIFQFSVSVVKGFKSKKMKLLYCLKVLIGGVKEYITLWHKCKYVEYHNNGISMRFPVIWTYDNIDAIKIGLHASIGAFSEIIVLSESPYSKAPGRLTIEERAVIGSHANIRAAGGEIFIGRNSLLGQQVSLIASNHKVSSEQPYRDLPWDETKTGVFIDENVWIGSGVTILPGCVISKNSVVGAGSVVTKSVPENEVWAGVPARKLRSVA